MSKNLVNLKEVVEPFKNMSIPKKSFIINCLQKNRSVVLNNLSNGILKEKDIMKNLKEKTLIKKLKDAGIPSDDCQILYDYCYYIAEPLSDAQFVKQLSAESLNALLNFMIHQVFIYKDFNNYFSNSTRSLTGFNKTKNSVECMRFAYHHILLVADRTTSPETLKLLLKLDFDLPEKLAEMFYVAILENAKDLHLAYLLNQVNGLSEQVEKISAIFEELDENEDIETKK
jgi:hypothetical protein